MSWFPKTNVLVPVDFSNRSMEAVDVGLSLVSDPTQLHVINVGPDIVSGDPGFGWKPLEAATRRGQITQAIMDRLNEPRHQGIQIHIKFGDPGNEIASFAEENDMELIVMPSHGRTGLKRLLIGSVAERVLRLAHCPVLVLRK